MVICGVTLFAILFALPAQANSLVSTSPISGSTFSVAPSAVTLTVQSALTSLGNSVTVVDPKGVRVDDGSLTIAGMEAIVGLKALSVSGDYLVTYALFSDNDAPLKGNYTFHFTAPSVISIPTANASGSPTQPGSAGSVTSSSILVVGLLFAAIIVFLLLAFYARKILKKR